MTEERERHAGGVVTLEGAALVADEPDLEVLLAPPEPADDRLGFEVVVEAAALLLTEAGAEAEAVGEADAAPQYPAPALLQ